MSWTVKTLKKYLEQRLELNEKARKVAKKEMNRRLDGMNEFREQLKDQTSSFITRNEYDLKHEVLNQLISSISAKVNIGIGIFLFLQLLIGAMIIHLMTKP